jgi:hypothetical protein
VRALRVLLKLVKYAILVVVMSVIVGLIWLRVESHLPRDAWFVERQGRLVAAVVTPSTTPQGQLTESVLLESDSGLSVSIRVIRSDPTGDPLPVLIVLGGHRTGSNAVDLSTIPTMDRSGLKVSARRSLRWAKRAGPSWTPCRPWR